METAKLRAIESIVKQNKLDVHKKFSSDYITRNGFYSDAQEVADVAIDKMLEYCEMGLNGGFTREIKDAIDDLSKIVVVLTTVQNGETKKIKSYKGQVDKVIITGKKGAQAIDPRMDIDKYITTTISAIEAVINNKQLFGSSVDDQLGNLGALKAKLAELQTRLNDVHNFTSKEAAEKAREITKRLLDVRLQLSRLFVSLEVVSYVDDALRMADEWAALAVATDRKHLAKKDDFPTYVEDNISTLAGSERTLNNIELFRKRFEEMEARIVNPISIQNSQKRLDEINIELIKIAEAQQAVVREFQNTGDRAKAERQASELKAKKTALDKEKQDLQRKIEVHRKTNGARIQIVERFKRDVYEPIMNDLQDDPMQLCVTVSLMDLGSVLSMLGGNFTQNDVDAATRTLLTARTQAKKKLEALIKASKELGDTEEWLRESEERLLDELGQLDGHSVEVEQTQEISALDELLGTVTVTPIEAETNPKQTAEQDIKGPIPLTDDDK